VCFDGAKTPFLWLTGCARRGWRGLGRGVPGVAALLCSPGSITG